MDTAFILQMLAAQYHGDDVFDVASLGETTGVYWCAKRVGDITLVCLRGSTTPEDWLRDLAAIPVPFAHSVLGVLHPGFSAGMSEVWQLIKQNCQPPYIIAGHSLGAARTAILSGLMMLDGTPPLKRVECGEPRPGGPKLRAILASIPTEIYRTRSGSAVDHISEVPLWPYVASGPITDLPATPQGGGPFALHHMDIYQAGLVALRAKTP